MATLLRSFVDQSRGARGQLLRYSNLDAILVGLSVVHGGLLFAVPSVPLIAIGLWWTANTVAHNFLHLPFFRQRRANQIYSVYLSLLLGVPQSLWRQRHLAHHAGRRFALKVDRLFMVEFILVVALWGTLAVETPRAFVGTYLPGWLIGLGLCYLQGHYEHDRGTTSHYGRIYNTIFFNDGYHVEHHAAPAKHWARLTAQPAAATSISRWPPVLRWLDVFSLDGLEHAVVRSPILQRYVVRVHERAFKRLVPQLAEPSRITIVGGGLFPRTAIIARRLWPNAALEIVDADARHLDMVRSCVDDRTELTCRRFDPTRAVATDLVIAPLAYVGNRAPLYECAGARAVIVHDWIWNSQGTSVIVSPWLLKRLNLVQPAPANPTTDVS